MRAAIGPEGMGCVRARPVASARTVGARTEEQVALKRVAFAPREMGTTVAELLVQV
jgi:hypothetical protein